MALLDIIIAPDPRLKQKAKPVDAVDDSVRQLMDDLLETMYKAQGIGLAATQVGDLRRVLVMDLAPEGAPPSPMRLANPEVIETSTKINSYEEGCLSLPDHYAEVKRPATIKLRYLDEQNEIRELEADGLLATCVQHEIDHLDGKIFVDHVSSLKRNMILRKLTKTKKAGVAV
ncbi:MAG: peptide deformylase [Magnetovibrionaceae bacterium]